MILKSNTPLIISSNMLAINYKFIDIEIIRKQQLIGKLCFASYDYVGITHLNA